MGLTELYIYIHLCYIEWVNWNTWFTYLIMGTFSCINNVQRHFLWALYLLYMYCVHSYRWCSTLYRMLYKLCCTIYSLPFKLFCTLCRVLYRLCCTLYRVLLIRIKWLVLELGRLRWAELTMVQNIHVSSSNLYSFLVPTHSSNISNSFHKTKDIRMN